MKRCIGAIRTHVYNSTRFIESYSILFDLQLLVVEVKYTMSKFFTASLDGSD